jgi:hypothetical protein
MRDDCGSGCREEGIVNIQICTIEDGGETKIGREHGTRLHKKTQTNVNVKNVIMAAVNQILQLRVKGRLPSWVECMNWGGTMNAGSQRRTSAPVSAYYSRQRSVESALSVEASG